jgi:hypothetical protein
MALEKTIEITDGFGDQKIFKNSYIRVENISGNKTRLLADVKFYKDSGSTGKPVKQSIQKFSPDLDGDNFIAQAYNYLKTLPEFSGAKDC